MVVRRIARRLHDEDVLAAHILVDLDEDFLIGEALDARLGEREIEIGGDRLGQRWIGVAGENLHAMLPCSRHRSPSGGDP